MKPRSIALLLLAAVLALPAAAEPIRLGSEGLWVRDGFDDTWTRAVPATAGDGWTRVEAASGVWPFLVRDLDGVRGGIDWSLLPRAAGDWTVLVPFKGDLTLLNMSDPAVMLAHAGQAWAMYLNGVLIRNEMAAGDGTERSLRNVVASLDKRLLVRGWNVLAFRIHGDPSSDRTGFNRAGPYVIDSYRTLMSGRREYLSFMLIGIYLFFAAYHGVLFALRPSNRGYLYFGISTFLLAAYLAARTDALAGLVADTASVQRIEYLALFLAVPAFLAFLEYMLDGRLRRLSAWMAGAFAVLAAASQAFRREPFLYAWYGLSALAFLRFAAFTLGPALVREYRALRGRLGGPAGRRALGALLGLVPRTMSGKLALGLAALAAAAAVDAAGLASGGGLSASRYALFAFLLGSAALLAAQFAAAYAGVESMTAGLKVAVEERTAELARAASERTRLNEELAKANRGYRDAMDERARDMSIAVSVQAGFFPRRPPALRDWDLAFAFEPASGVSGDFFDFYDRDGELLGLLLGEVSGRSIASGLITLLVKNSFFRRSIGREREPLGALFAEIDRELTRELSSVDNRLGAAFLRVSGSRVEYANAAHADALLRKAGGREVAALSSGGAKAPALGGGRLTERLATLEFGMEKGDCLLLYTDGLVGGRDRKDREYGMERLVAAFRKADIETAEAALASVMIDFRNFSAGARRSDDLTVIALRRR